MRSKEPAVHAGGASIPPGDRPGSRPARLSEVGKQLEILLEDVDLDEEPAMADALAAAVSATARATDLVDGDRSARRAGASGGATRDRRDETAVGERSATRRRADRYAGRVATGDVALARRTGAE